MKRKNACVTIGEAAPNFDGLVKTKWAEAQAKEAAVTRQSDAIEFAGEIRNWLLGYLTDEIRGELKAQGKPCIDDNWQFWTDTMVEPIAEFENYGTEFAIYRITEHHRYCEARFNTYMLGYAGQENEQYPYYLKFLSYAKLK